MQCYLCKYKCTVHVGHSRGGSLTQVACAKAFSCWKGMATSAIGVRISLLCLLTIYTVQGKLAVIHVYSNSCVIHRVHLGSHTVQKHKHQVWCCMSR